MSVCEKLPLKHRYNILMNEKQLESLAGRGKSADCYIHFTSNLWNCIYAVVEVKGRKIRDALMQLENTCRVLLSKGEIIKLAILIVRGISRQEQRIYEILKNRLYRKKGKRREPVRILKRIDLYVVRRG